MGRLMSATYRYTKAQVNWLMFRAWQEGFETAAASAGECCGCNATGTNPYQEPDTSKPDPTNPSDLRVPSFERVSDFSFDPENIEVITLRPAE